MQLDFSIERPTRFIFPTRSGNNSAILPNYHLAAPLQYPQMGYQFIFQLFVMVYITDINPQRFIGCFRDAQLSEARADFFHLFRSVTEFMDCSERAFIKFDGGSVIPQIGKGGP